MNFQNSDDQKIKNLKFKWSNCDFCVKIYMGHFFSFVKCSSCSFNFDFQSHINLNFTKSKLTRHHQHLLKLINMVVKNNNIIWWMPTQQTKLEEINVEGEKETKMVKDFYQYHMMISYISSSLTSKSPDFYIKFTN